MWRRVCFSNAMTCWRAAQQRARAKMGDCHPILGPGTPLFPTIMQHENRWLSPFFALGVGESGLRSPRRLHRDEGARTSVRASVRPSEIFCGVLQGFHYGGTSLFRRPRSEKLAVASIVRVSSRIVHVPKAAPGPRSPRATFTWLGLSRPVLLGPVDEGRPTLAQARFNGLPFRRRTRAPRCSFYSFMRSSLR